MLKARVITALILAAAFLGALFGLPPLGWLIFAAGIAALAGWEWAGLASWSGQNRILFGAITGLLSLALMLLTASVPAKTVSLTTYGLAAAFWLLGIPLWLNKKFRLGNTLVAVLVGWVLLLPSCLALVEIRQVSPVLLLAVMASVWVADIAAYFTGRAIGKNKLAPNISPGKTWEGAGGALAGVLIYGFALDSANGHPLTSQASLALVVLLLVLLTAVSIIGDLFESLMKRQAGIKDSSHLLPGHGGVLDRIDSLTSTLPLVGLLLLLWHR